MAENTQNQDTQNRKRGKFDLSNYRAMKIDHQGDPYIISEQELSYLEGFEKKYPIVKANFELAKERNTKLKTALRDKSKALEEQQQENKKMLNKMQKLAEKNMILEEELSRYKLAYEKLQMEHEVLKADYSKFKINMGGRNSILSEEEQLTIKGWALRGYSVTQIHQKVNERLNQEGQGRKVSYETIRRLVSGVKP